ncbi:Gfo/Idh/MocA family protein [Campylobacter suis]|uniref:Gfo/Idh/MocA family oxidoreductase n=1 Tax=Campylobacter suis TaxID=2790657 RepID=A0ABN7K894_9BACT|nr:Gfo/Idh/MocA family oxidoreductase [Campylobacter suis]CAD7288723.1 hypothetical protein LMG8286_01487 [Campylobacter suis]
MRALIVGFGSIGRRHYDVLLALKKFSKIDLVTSQKELLLNDQVTTIYESLDDVLLSEYEYFLIATPTALHQRQLKFIDDRVSGKCIFCEKPLFEKFYDLKAKNDIFVGYVLRYHPLILKTKELLFGEKILSANIKCAQYLPTWRAGDYTQCYSSKRELGGGVLLDLSHEIDYALWFFGEFDEIKSFNSKISDLKITSDDIAVILARAGSTFVSMQVDYISKLTHRQIFIDTQEFSIFIDLIKNELIKKDKEGFEEKTSVVLERNDMFKSMHLDILGDRKNVCTFEQAMSVMRVIKSVQEQNDGSFMHDMC